MNRKKKKILKILVASIFIIGGIFVYIESSHIGYLEYQFYNLTDNKVKALETKLYIVLEDKPEELFTEFQEVIETFPESANTCHGIAHKLGHRSYRLYGFERSMQIGRPLCGAGFLHGVLESELGSFTNSSDLVQIGNLCKETDEKCNHGLGHGLMVLTNNRFKEALSYCGRLGDLARSDCYDGVFMHIFDNEETGVSKKIPERAEEELLCAGLEDQYKKSCYFFLPRVFAHEESMDVKAWSICGRTFGVDHVLCVVGSGSMFAKYEYSNPQKVEKMCSIFLEYTPLCNEGASLYREKPF